MAKITILESLLRANSYQVPTMPEVSEDLPKNAVIKVFGVGGGGGNAIRHMIASNIEGVDFISVNTDAQALAGIDHAIQIGNSITKGLGAGANPEIGRQSAMEDRQKIADMVKDCDMAFITAGMGGGTGTGAAPVIAEVAREMGVLTVAVVTKPFNFEGKKRMQVAESGLSQLEKCVDSLITIPNENLLSVMGKKASLLDAFGEANNVLLGAVQGISDLITRSGIINVDFADVKTVMSEMGKAMMGTGTAIGDNRAREATELAINSPLLEDVSLQGARGILVNITAGIDLNLGEFSEVGEIVRNIASDDATVVVGTVIDDTMGESLKVTVVATGIDTIPTLTAVKAAEEKVAEKPSGEVKSEKPEEPEVKKRDGTLDYNQLDRPAVARRAGAQPPTPERSTNFNHERGADNSEKNFELLDIPSFLRRQVN